MRFSIGTNSNYIRLQNQKLSSTDANSNFLRIPKRNTRTTTGELSSTSNTQLVNKRNHFENRMNTVVGEFEHGVPITPELAIELRQLVFGTAAAPPRSEWTRTAFIFNAANQESAYGLLCQRNGTRGMLSVLQGFILKYFLFDRRSRDKTSTFVVDQVLRPTESQQIDALISSMAEILQMIAEKGKIFIVLPGEEAFIPHSITYFQDSVTEKLYIFELRKREDTAQFLKRNLRYFTEDPGPGAMLFLYSAVLTRTMCRVRTDLDGRRGSYLISAAEEGSLNIVTLLLTGRATPYLHNGVIHVGDEEHYALPQYGILNRSLIGLLIWESDKNNSNVRQPGSRLKTPSLPIWITCCAGHYGVIYNTNQELLRNYHAESRFELFYYSCSGNQITMTVDNRMHNERATFMLHRQSSTVNHQNQPEKEETITTPLERLIHTKWEEGSIKFHTQPSMLSYLFSTSN